MGGIIYQGKSLVNRRKLIGMSGSPIHHVPNGLSYYWANQFPIRSGFSGQKKQTSYLSLSTKSTLGHCQHHHGNSSQHCIAPVAPVASILLIPLPMIDLFLRMTELTETRRDKEQRQTGVSTTQTKLGTSGISHVRDTGIRTASSLS